MTQASIACHNMKIPCKFDLAGDYHEQAVLRHRTILRVTVFSSAKTIRMI